MGGRGVGPFVAVGTSGVVDGCPVAEFWFLHVSG